MASLLELHMEYHLTSEKSLIYGHLHQIELLPSDIYIQLIYLELSSKES